MLAICEDCAKKYNVDESRIKGEKARFSCYECGHIIVVEKPKVVEPPPEMSKTPETKPMTDEETTHKVAMASPEEQQDNNSSTSESKGRSAKTALIATLIAGVLVACGIIVYMYL